MLSLGYHQRCSLRVSVARLQHISRSDGTSGHDLKRDLRSQESGINRLTAVRNRLARSDSAASTSHVFEHIQRPFKGCTRNLHMRRPAAELLIGCDAIGEHAFIDIGKMASPPWQSRWPASRYVDPGPLLARMNALAISVSAAAAPPNRAKMGTGLRFFRCPERLQTTLAYSPPSVVGHPVDASARAGSRYRITCDLNRLCLYLRLAHY